jgi:hypothetical protein
MKRVRANIPRTPYEALAQVQPPLTIPPRAQHALRRPDGTGARSRA